MAGGIGQVGALQARGGRQPCAEGATLLLRARRGADSFERTDVFPYLSIPFHSVRPCKQSSTDYSNPINRKVAFRSSFCQLSAPKARNDPGQEHTHDPTRGTQPQSDAMCPVQHHSAVPPIKIRSKRSTRLPNSTPCQEPELTYARKTLNARKQHAIRI
jgi:hypothetical protein